MTWDGITERRDVSWREVTDHMEKTNVVLGELVDKVGKQNGRIAKLENWRSYMLGGIAVIVFIIGIITKSH